LSLFFTRKYEAFEAFKKYKTHIENEDKTIKVLCVVSFFKKIQHSSTTLSKIIKPNFVIYMPKFTNYRSKKKIVLLILI
jgi:hypothetical protein